MPRTNRVAIDAVLKQQTMHNHSDTFCDEVPMKSILLALKSAARTVGIAFAVVFSTVALACPQCQIMVQQSMYMNQNIQHTRNLQQQTATYAQRHEAQNEQRAGRNTTKTNAPSSAPSIPAGQLVYQSDPRVSDQIKRQMLDAIIAEGTKRGRMTQSNAEALRNEFAKIDINKIFAVDTAKIGLKTNDTATALTAFITVGFSIMNDGRMATPAQQKALYVQLQRALLPGKRTSDIDMQKFSEGLYWTAYINMLDYGNAKNKTPGYTTANVKNSVRQTLKTYNIDPAQMRIGTKGLE